MKNAKDVFLYLKARGGANGSPNGIGELCSPLGFVI